MDEDREETPRICVSGTTYRGGSDCSVTISGLTKDETERIHGMMRNGMWWVSTNRDKRLTFSPGYEEPPGPVTDEEMLPFWRRLEPNERPVQMDLFDLEAYSSHSSPGIVIKHLCGYFYTPERYREQAALLESYGFECLRSRRGLDGEYWEVWFLPSLFFAAGDLKDAMAKKQEVSKALEFLRRNCSFGTCDVVVQRLAMEIPD